MKFLYVCVVAVVILGVSHVQCDMRDDLHKISDACAAESNVNEDELKNFFKGGMKDEEAKENLKCHMKCVMEKQGHMKNGAFDEAAAKKTLQAIPALKDQQDKIDKSLAECKTKKGATECDTAYQIMKCMGEHKAAM